MDAHARNHAVEDADCLVIELAVAGLCHAVGVHSAVNLAKSLSLGVWFFVERLLGGFLLSVKPMVEILGVEELEFKGARQYEEHALGEEANLLDEQFLEFEWRHVALAEGLVLICIILCLVGLWYYDMVTVAEETSISVHYVVEHIDLD